MSTVDTGVKPSSRQAGSLTPAFMEGKKPGADSAEVPVFANPIEGHVDAGVSHDGDIGRISN